MRFLCRLLAILLVVATTTQAWDWLPATDNNRTLDTNFVIKAPLRNDASIPRAQRQGLEQTDFYLYNYVTTDYNATKAQRAVIMLHGLGRDAWSYFDQTHQALLEATSRTSRKTHKSRLRADEVIIMAPVFLNREDAGSFPVDEAGEPTSNALVWDNGTWAQGADSVFPSTLYDTNGLPFAPSGISSFQALDKVVSFFSDKTIFPNINTIIIAGHSLGAQMVQRYALIGAVPSATVPVHFVVANPGSFAYLSDWRPRTYVDCLETFNQWKYGLSSYSQSYLSDFIAQSLNTDNDIESVIIRYRKRIVAYLLGLADHGKGDTRCEAKAQGLTHLTRGRNFIKHLEQMDGGFPATHSVDYIANVSHDGPGMFQSKAGLERLFYINLNGTESPTAVGDDDGSVAHWIASHNGSASSAVRPLPVLVISILVAFLASGLS